MALAEKILELRTSHGLSQGDLAEALDVSRQSVSKWETGQSVPDLDKIIKLADLFDVTVDQLVRDRDTSFVSQPPAQPLHAEQIPPNTMSAPRVTGILLAFLGVGMMLLGLAVNPGFLLVSLLPLVSGLSLLLVRKHPWFVTGWILWAGSFLIYNVWTTGGTLLSALNDLVRGRLDVTDAIHLIRFALLLLMLTATVRLLGRKGPS